MEENNWKFNHEKNFLSKWEYNCAIGEGENSAASMPEARMTAREKFSLTGSSASNTVCIVSLLQKKEVHAWIWVRFLSV